MDCFNQPVCTRCLLGLGVSAVRYTGAMRYNTPPPQYTYYLPSDAERGCRLLSADCIKCIRETV